MKKEQYELTLAQQERVLQNTGLVYYIVNKYNNYSWQQEDLVQIGMLGLCKAAATFDESKGVKFGTYAARCIDNEIKMFLRAERKNSNLPHLEDVLNTNFAGDELTTADIVEDKNAFSFTESANREKLEKILSIILNILSYKESYTMLLAAAGFTQCEIANILEISQSYISRVVNRCYKKIKNFENKNKPHQEKFKVKVQEEKIIIIFSTEGIANLQEFHSRFLASAENVRDNVGFNITYQRGKATFETALDEAVFELSAVLITELDKFQVKDRIVQTPTPTTMQQNKQVEERKKQGEEVETISNEEKEKDKSVADQMANGAMLEKLAIQNHAIQLKCFSLLQIREQFPNSSILEIAIAINELLRKKVIYISEKGDYRVN